MAESSLVHNPQRMLELIHDQAKIEEVGYSTDHLIKSSRPSFFAFLRCTQMIEQ